MSHDASVHPAECRGRPAPTHRPQGLHASGVAHRADDHHQAQPPGLLSQEGRQKPAPKKIPQTEAIFDQVNRINQAADSAADVLRVSIDAKATVTIGPFSRGGKRRVAVAAADHDFAPEAPVTPVGLFLPTWAELFVYGVTSKVTSACLGDRLAPWWEAVRERFAHITTRGINLDNGPENPSRRPQFMQRLV